MSRPRRTPFTVLVRLLTVLALSLSGCSAFTASDSSFSVDLSLREAIPEVGSIEPQPLRIAVAAVLSPEGTVESYAELAKYLGDRFESIGSVLVAPRLGVRQHG